MRVRAELHTPRLLLRSWRPDDAEAVGPVLEANWDWVSPWIPARVAQPAPLPELTRRLASFAENFDADREWRFGVFSRESKDVLGELAMFARSATARVPLADADRCEIGYWIRQDAAGRGYVTEAAQAVLDMAAGIPQFRLAEIHCAARNAPSSAVARRLGFKLTSTTEEPGVPAIVSQVWTLDFGAAHSRP